MLGDDGEGPKGDLAGYGTKSEEVSRYEMAGKESKWA